VRQHLVTGDVAARLAVVDFERPGQSRDRAELLGLSAGVRGPGVSVFLVRVIDFVLGLSGAPGPQGVPGTALSGIAVGVELVGGPDDLGRAIAHELGHHLGLFHPTEPDGRVVEPLPDTPVCPIDRDADGDGFLVRSECTGAGGENLMFWDHPGGLELTPEQIDVLARALVLR
jgi:hypothetical protein